MMSFQTEQLRTFLAVLEEGTFEAAALRLHVSPSAISQRVKAMEQAAGQVLLKRSTPIDVTPAGAVVHKLARQLRQLEADAAAELGLGGGRDSLAIVVNADSLATWFLDALTLLPSQDRMSLEILREDEQHSVALLRSGEVMAAITATASPVQGCSVMPLGAMEYRPVAARGFFERWFSTGCTADSLTVAPAIQFDRTDTLQNNFIETVAGMPLRGPSHFIPDTVQFGEAVKRGLGWGLMPESHCLDGLRDGSLLELVPGHVSRIPLYWQRWKIQSASLDLLTETVRTAAAGALSQNPPRQNQLRRNQAGENPPRKN